MSDVSRRLKNIPQKLKRVRSFIPYTDFLKVFVRNTKFALSSQNLLRKSRLPVEKIWLHSGKPWCKFAVFGDSILV